MLQAVEARVEEQLEDWTKDMSNELFKKWMFDLTTEEKKLWLWNATVELLRIKQRRIY